VNGDPISKVIISIIQNIFEIVFKKMTALFYSRDGEVHKFMGHFSVNSIKGWAISEKVQRSSFRVVNLFKFTYNLFNCIYPIIWISPNKMKFGWKFKGGNYCVPVGLA